MTDIESLRRSFMEELSKASQRSELEALRTSFLGRRSFIKEEFRRLPELPEEERRAYAARLNELSQQMQGEIDARVSAARKAETAKQLEAEWLDVTLPGQAHRVGSWHPLTEVEQRCLTVLRKLGFERLRWQMDKADILALTLAGSGSLDLRSVSHSDLHGQRFVPFPTES
ncbi:hypothetical protein [Streptomyces sp. NPDC002133]|uniref:hypothetical protein n=1 Tax=Streptomyces sp. NPDC002133 TaxID=3154409 RepID=UPI0033201A7E